MYTSYSSLTLRNNHIMTYTLERHASYITAHASELPVYIRRINIPPRNGLVYTKGVYTIAMDLPLTDSEQNSASSNASGDSAEDVNIRLNEDRSIIASTIALHGVQVIQFASVLL